MPTNANTRRLQNKLLQLRELTVPQEARIIGRERDQLSVVVVIGDLVHNLGVDLLLHRPHVAGQIGVQASDDLFTQVGGTKAQRAVVVAHGELYDRLQSCHVCSGTPAEVVDATILEGDCHQQLQVAFVDVRLSVFFIL